MKIINKSFLSIKSLEEELDLSALDKEKTFIQVFSGFVLKAEVEKIQSIIKKKNQDLIFIGATTAGEIFEGQSLEKSISISILEFERSTPREGFFIDEDDFTLGVTLGSQLLSKQTKAVILFIDGLTTNGNDLIDGISSVNCEVPLAGGLAAEDGRLENTFVFDQNGVYTKGCVAVALDSEVLHVYTEYQLNWEAIGQTMTVTKAEKNRLYELDGINVSEMYSKYLGSNVGSNLPYSAVEFPLLKIEDDGLEICRTFIHQFEEDKSLLTIGNLEVGDKVRFSFGNIDLILKSTKSSLKRYNALHAEALFVYSCAARKSLLESNVARELLPLKSIAPNIGFFTYGEIYHSKNKNSLLNESFTILALSEKSLEPLREFSPSKTSETELDKIDNFMKDKHFLILDALTHLSNTVITELEEAQQQLKDQSNRDFLTGLYNRRYFNEVAENFINISKREKKISSLISIDIDKFKNINDTYGHSTGDEVIKHLATTLLKTARKSDIVSRFGGEEFIILLPLTDIDGAYKIAEKLRNCVEKSQITLENGEIITYTISLGVDSIKESDREIKQVLNRADKALYIAKATGRNRVVLADKSIT